MGSARRTDDPRQPGTGAVPVPVLAVLGAQRTGSTLLATALGMVPGAWVAGELRLLWASLDEGRPCACLRPCTTCPTWKAVLDRVFDTPELRDVRSAELARLSHTYVRQRHLLRLLTYRPGRGHALDPLAAATRRLYESLAAETGASVVVDSSKSAAFLTFLARIPGIDVRPVHLVRDPRGVVDSWSRDKRWARDGWAEGLRRQSASRATAGWMGMNLGAEAYRMLHRSRPIPRLRFEDFLTTPEAVLRDLVDLAGLPQPADDALPLDPAGPSVLISENHAIAGNVDRFDVGPAPLRREEAWRLQMPARTQLAVGLACAPLLSRYGYRLRPAAR